jgi:hypothetical protein
VVRGAPPAAPAASKIVSASVMKAERN